MDTYRQKVKDEVAAVERGSLPKPFRHLSLAMCRGDAAGRASGPVAV